MRTWQAVVRELQHHASALPEPLCDIYEVAPPAGESWPESLPKCPALEEFYKLCDGGTIGLFNFLALGELESTTEETQEWIGEDGHEELPPPGHWFVFGYNEFSHRVIWNTDQDDVVVYDTDGGDVWSAADKELAYDGTKPATPERVTMAQFLANLVLPVTNPDESDQLWADALRELDRLTGTIPSPD